MAQVTLQVRGLDCAEEVSLLRDQLQPIPGVQELSFDILRGQTTIAFDEQLVNTSKLIDEVSKTGLRACECAATASGAASAKQSGRSIRMVLCISSGLLGLAGYGGQLCQSSWPTATAHSFERPSAVILCAYLLATICGLWLVLPKAWSAIHRLRPDMNLLMTLAATGALVIGEYSEAATVSFLFSLSLVLESWSIDRARHAVESLMALSPKTAHKIQSDGTESQCPASDISVGATIRVRPGDLFPLDGEIVRGETTVNQAPITGESTPVSKSIGDQVFAGTINEDGVVDVVTSKLADDSVLARILRMIGEAQKRRSSIEHSIERFARYYTPLVMILSLLIMTVPPLLLHGAWAMWFYQGLVLLVIACPCALVISTPVSVVAAMTSTAGQGVLVKGGHYLELAADLQAIAFDKTGTLTVGKPEVCQVIPLNGISEKALFEIAASISAMSHHPLSRAITRYAASREIAVTPATEFRSLAGRGITAFVAGQQYWIGSIASQLDPLHSPELLRMVESMNDQATSMVVISDDRQVLGIVTFRDAIRPDAAECVAELRRRGVERIVLLTGDNPKISSQVSKAVGIDEIRTELLPEHKVAAISELTRQYGVAAMVGDGVNDAPAMAAASFGIAMGHSGADTALETADVVLMNDDLLRIPWLISHSRRMRAIIRQNIFASITVKAAVVLLTLAGLGSMWAAIAADTGMSLAVVANALRLLTANRGKSAGQQAG